MARAVRSASDGSEDDPRGSWAAKTSLKFSNFNEAVGCLAVRIEFKCCVSAPFLIDNHGSEILATRNTSYLTTSKSLNSRKIARMARILTIFGPKSSQRRDLFLIFFRTNEKTNKRTKKPNERKSHRPGRRYRRWCLRFS